MKKWIAGIGAVVLLGAGAAATVVAGSDTTVERVIDGDTVDVSTWSGTKRVRLLNINAPELAHDDAPEECLAQEAKDRLEELLPEGTKVTLEYDVDRQDRYGRELAGVFKGTDFVNEQMVRDGFARAVLFEPNRKFYDRILAAEAGPRADQKGVFGAEPGCLVDGAPAPAEAQDQPAPSNVADTYTGCRAYGGNYSLNNVDKNGRRYAKIDCNTKEQID